MHEFDDALLESPDALRAADHLLRPLAEAGARVRREVASAESPLERLGPEDRPRAILLFGPEARLLRAVLEPTCPVPLVAWPRLGLPGWVGPLDLVVVMGGGGKVSLAAAFEAVRRGSRLLVVCPADSLLAKESASASTTLLPTSTGDSLAAAVLALLALHRLGLGPVVSPEAVAEAMDQVAADSSLGLDVAQNPAKAVALELADAKPLVWGGSILAARASRRVAEALRSACGDVVLSADAGALLPLLDEVPLRDPFADPFEESGVEPRPGLVLVDDGMDDEQAAEERTQLRNSAMAKNLLVSNLAHTSGSEVERYVTVLQQGLFAAAYLRIGLGRV